MNLQYDRQMELKEQGVSLCPYVRNPTETRGACALTEEWNRCHTPFRADYQNCRCYKNWEKEVGR